MPRRDKTVVVDADQYARLKPYLEANGVSLTEVVNRAIKEDLESRHKAPGGVKRQKSPARFFQRRGLMSRLSGKRTDWQDAQLPGQHRYCA
jgi:hypothetical protein